MKILGSGLITSLACFLSDALPPARQRTRRWCHFTSPPLLLLLVCFVSACAAGGGILPHRQQWEMFPQANSPPAECPGQYHEEVYSDGNFFIYCWGRNN